VNSLIRRKLLGVLGSGAMAGIALLILRPGSAGQRANVKAGELAVFPVQNGMPLAGEAIEDPLLPEASQWVDRLRARGTTKLAYPVSNLQREFRLGYARACALADCLAQRGEWTLAYDDGGTRHARIHRLA
jgi:DNA segregation ATPase FtsK/SpoIIIE-like protein